MKIAVFSDIHANGPAFEAVLQDVTDRGLEHFWCLGDMIGYYSDPIEPLLFVKKYVDADNWVMGNHEAMLADLVLPQDLPLPKGQTCLEVKSKAGVLRVRGLFMEQEQWQATNATPVVCLKLNRESLDTNREADEFWRKAFTVERMKPRLKHLDGREHILVHASQSKNYVGRYLYSWQQEFLLPREFQLLANGDGSQIGHRTMWFGHTHVPTLVYGVYENDSWKSSPVFIEPDQTYSLGHSLAIVNPGSIGQPRDADPRAAYAILDTDADTVTFIRVEYDFRETAQRLIARNYPLSLAHRLREAPPVKTTPEIWRQHYLANRRKSNGRA